MTAEESLQKITELLPEINGNPDICEIVTSFCAVFGIIASIVSLVITIKAQNKQSLFQKRIDVYITCYTFLNSVNDISKLLKEAKIRLGHNYPSSVYPEFIAITNINFFGDTQMVINNFNEEKYRFNFLEKLGELKSIREKITLLFEGEDAKKLQNFIKNYYDTVAKMYKYEILRKRIEKDDCNIKEINSSVSPKQMYDFYGEPQLRKELRNSINNLLKSKGVLMKYDTLNKLRKQIALWRYNKCSLTKTR